MKITIITVCYNSAKTIENAIQSVISQNYHDLEYIIIDGGSTDGTLDIIETYKDDISLWISEPDNGIYDAMNKGIQRASGDVIAFLNSDDWYVLEADVFNQVERYFIDSGADIISGNIYYVNNEGLKRTVPLNKMTDENILLGAVYPHPAMFVKREIYLKMGCFDTSYKIAADNKWIIDAYMNGVKMLLVDDYFTCFREGGVSTAGKYDAMQEQFAIALDCAQRYHLTQMEEKIITFYTEMLQEIKREKCLESVLTEKPKELRERFDYSKGYYIWGTGVRGKKCLQIFQRLALPLKGFIDSNRYQESFSGYTVIKPEEIDQESYICITPKNYEDEIKSQLICMGIHENQIFTYSDMTETIITGSFLLNNT